MQVNKFWSMRKEGEKTGGICLYGEIASSEFWGEEVTPKEFKEELDELGDVETLNVYINSEGGDVFAGRAIINILQRHPAKKIGYNDGLAASMAFDIIMTMDKVIAGTNSHFMTHNAAARLSGNKNELRKAADLVESIDEEAVEAMAKRSGRSKDEMRAMQDKETWLTARQALAYGLADEISESHKVDAKLNGDMMTCGIQLFDLSKFKNRPDLKESTEGTTGTNQRTCKTKTETATGEIQPCNGRNCEPVKDTDQARNARKAQRERVYQLRRKISGGEKNNGGNL